ncbi:trehalose 6-phosphate phosphatase [Rhodoblastus sphagnicola]|nr:trehalose-phosphatase [Rhodoblastus sphagnicola]MBB4200331.1 trehalose 6-phosphate phosphatase [Rhodoblastus sphagnicola]
MKWLAASGDDRSMFDRSAKAPTELLAQPDLPVLGDPQTYCIFLDFDGTLVEIADRPEDVRIDPTMLQFLENLRDASGRALALVSGRDIGVIDRLIHPLILPVAGVHGLQRRDAAGRLHSPIIDQSIVEAIAAEAAAAFRLEPGVVIEKKTGAVAIHFRLRPDFEKPCLAFARKILRTRSDLNLIEGKMVCEIRLSGSDKGAVVDAFLIERPFKGKTPIFAGDDATDEPAFATVNARDGLSIKVGAGPTVARFCVKTIHDLRDWLEGLMAPEQRQANARNAIGMT